MLLALQQQQQQQASQVLPGLQLLGHGTSLHLWRSSCLPSSFLMSPAVERKSPLSTWPSWKPQSLGCDWSQMKRCLLCLLALNLRWSLNPSSLLLPLIWSFKDPRGCNSPRLVSQLQNSSTWKEASLKSPNSLSRSTPPQSEETINSIHTMRSSLTWKRKVQTHFTKP